jgi:hypothetical protein
MTVNEEIQRLESELEVGKRNFQEDAQLINEKLRETREQLSPTHFVQKNVLWISAVAMALGFALGYLGVPLQEIGKPAAAAMLTTAGKQAAERAIRGR